MFLQVVESKMSEGVGFDRHSVVVFEDEMRVFLQGLDKCIEFIEKNRATRQKEIAKKRQTKKTEASKMWKTTNKKDEEKDAKFTKKKVFLKKKQD